VQKYGGDARGNHTLPEIGDTVFVDFQGNNAELPIAMGTITSRKEKSGFSTPNNDLKVFRTRSGNKAILNDETGDITIESEKGQALVVVYGDGNIKLKAPKNIELEAGEDIIITAGKNIKIDGGQNISETAGANKTLGVGGIMNTKVDGDKTLYVVGGYHEQIDGYFHSHTEKERQETALEGIQNNTEKDIQKHAKNDIQNNSGENTTNN